MSQPALQTLTVTFEAPSKLTREAIGAQLAKCPLKVRSVRFHAMGRPRTTTDVVTQILALTGSYRSIAAQVGVSDVTVARVVREGR